MQKSDFQMETEEVKKDCDQTFHLKRKQIIVANIVNGVEQHKKDHKPNDNNNYN